MTPYRRRWLWLATVVPIFSVYLVGGCTDGTPVANASGSDGYLFCFWNVENLFDDQENERLQEPTANTTNGSPATRRPCS